MQKYPHEILHIHIIIKHMSFNVKRDLILPFHQIPWITRVI